MATLNLDGEIVDGALKENRLLFLEVKGLTGVDGSRLEGVSSAVFVTKLSPWHSTIMRIRMVAGEFLEEASDLVIAQFIQYFSEEVELLNYSPSLAEQNPKLYRSYQSRWVTLSTVIALISGTSANSLMQKRLGDISVRRDRAADELLYEARRQLKALEDNIKDGGDLGREIGVAVKGIDNLNAPPFGRLWADPASYDTEGIPAANSRAKMTSPGGRGLERNFKKRYTRRKLD
tara:strand:- start:1091 stop:1789 length:699 start_codon:yes stop_codon:yes gene_type:complete